MEFLLIGESKLKILLCESEMKEYGLDPPPEDSGGVGFRRAFYKIIDIAKHEVGFDPSGDKILIQFYPMRTGGCEVFVTKLGILSEQSRRLVTRSNRITIIERNKSYYSFDSLEDLQSCAVAVKRHAEGYSPKADVYFLNGTYYLCIEEYAKGGEPIEFPSLLEFSRQLTADFESYLSEHAELLCEACGIEIFSKLD